MSKNQSKQVDPDELHTAVDTAPDVDTSGVQTRGDIGPRRLVDAYRKYLAATEALDEQRAAADRLNADQQASATALDERAKVLTEGEEQLHTRVQAVTARERDADAGFTQRRREQLAGLEQELEPLQKTRAELDERLAALERGLVERQGRAEAELLDRLSEVNARCEARLLEANAQAERLLDAAAADADRLHSEAEKTLHTRREALNVAESALRMEQDALEIRRIRLDADEAELHARQARLEQEIQARATVEVQRSERVTQLLAKERDDLKQQYDKLAERYATLKQQDRRLDGVDAAAIERLRSENDRLHKQLDAAPSAADAATLTRLETDLDRAQKDARDAAAAAERLGAALQAQRHIHEDLQDLTSERDRALASRDALRSEVEHLREDLDLLRGAAESTAPDSDLVAIDDVAARDRAAGVPRLRHDDVDLETLVSELCAAMATAEDPRYYSEDLVRCFLAGLAGSHLHILEGISGTGKTSLPIAFARAAGFPVEVVEVQAAWRDRLDLVGHYSHLQRRYYSTAFARAVYRAATPAWRTAPMFVVLDEMNLSHPEQYFADLLSAIERPRGEGAVELLQSDGRGALLEDGRRLTLPPNVWFIGTANRDETTMTMADKTYDRAHLMELPSRFEKPASAEPPRQQGALGFDQLEALFKRAEAECADDAEWVVERLFDESVLEVLATRSVGVGSRLRRQAASFVPVFTAAGGERVDALDHLTATKLVRKLDAVFDLREDDLDLLEEAIDAAVGTPGLTSMGATQRELKRQRDRIDG